MSTWYAVRCRTSTASAYGRETVRAAAQSRSAAAPCATAGIAFASPIEKPVTRKTAAGTSRWSGGWAKKKSRYGTSPAATRNAR